MSVSNAEDRSRRMRTDERDEALAARRDSVTVRSPETDWGQEGCFVKDSRTVGCRRHTVAVVMGVRSEGLPVSLEDLSLQAMRW